MKFRLPQGTTRLAHAGKTVTVASDGTLDLDASVVAMLAPHGIVPVGDPVPVDPALVAGMTRADVAAALVARSVAFSSDASDVALRGLLRRALAKPTR